MKKVFNLLLLLILSVIVNAGNIVKNAISLPDPHIKVFNNKIYLFAGNDNNRNDKLWDMRFWKIYSSGDLVNWEKESVITPQNNYMPNNSKDCWACDASCNNGKYYFYFSYRNHNIGVMSSDSPGSGYKDVLGFPLIDKGHDPTILEDDDNKKYIVYGNKTIGGFYVAQLNDDMVSLAEKPRLIMIKGDLWDKAPDWQDKNYIYKYKDTYYLTWGRDYAVSKNIYGPYTCVGAVGNGYDLDEFAHGSIFEWKGQHYYIWCYYLRPGYKYRESIISFCHFLPQNKIIVDTKYLDNHYDFGVGQYSASWNKIEAEWFYEKSDGIEKNNNNGSLVMRNTKNLSWLRFSNMEFNKQNNVEYIISSNGNGLIEIRKGSVDGPLLSKKNIGICQNKIVKAKISPVNGKNDIYIVLKMDNNRHCDFDCLSFN